MNLDDVRAAARVLDGVAHRTPVMTSLITAGITLFGCLAYRNLPVSDLPNVDFPTITVNASLPGASPAGSFLCRATSSVRRNRARQ